MLDFPINSDARAVLAEEGPMSKTVQAVITETADVLLTPKLTRTGKMEATKRSPKPVADGVVINKSWPTGITSDAKRYGCF